MLKQESQERRAYYRIRDKIALQIQSPEVPATDSLLFDLLNELYLLELESQPLLRSISEKQRTLVNYLKITNKRIDLLANALAQGLLREFGEPRQVTLSEAGISFREEQARAIGTPLNLKLILLPQAFGLQVEARVVSSQGLKNGEYKTAVRFHALSDAQRQVLARHVLQKQAQERREALADHHD